MQAPRSKRPAPPRPADRRRAGEAPRRARALPPPPPRTPGADRVAAAIVIFSGS